MITITWVNAKQKASGMQRLSNRVGNEHTQKWARSVAEDGDQSFRYSVLSGGANQTIKGGPRVLEGDMFDSIGKRIAAAPGRAVVTTGFGIGKRAPKHTVYQEDGTPPRPGNRGIAAMLAVPEAVINMEIAAENNGMLMLSRIATEWNSI